jgi:L-alanine-DL-glutamate epimerase-like enolase superfamily enzyme
MNTNRRGWLQSFAGAGALALASPREQQAQAAAARATHVFQPKVLEVFQGCAGMKDGYLWVSEKPGWGIEVDEKAAARMPFTSGAGPRSGLNGGWGDLRLANGTVIKQ